MLHLKYELWRARTLEIDFPSPANIKIIIFIIFINFANIPYVHFHHISQTGLKLLSL